MRIFHLTENILPGDAISGNVLAIHASLKAKGIEGGIFTSYCYEKKNGIYPVNDLNKVLRKDDLLLYQYSIGSAMTEWFLRQNCHKAIIYQNITPEEYLRPYSPLLADAARRGREDLFTLPQQLDFAFASSAYSARELRRYGFQDVTVLPIFLEKTHFSEEADASMKERLSGGKTNILFVGRKAPNKKIEDLLLLSDYYACVSKRPCRLILAGDDSMSVYCDKLRALASRLNNIEVLWLGKIRQDELIACYQSADLFLCMSEHEGFCVPLLECMYYGVPILAYASTAVMETMGECGMKVPRKDYAETASLMESILSDQKLRDTLREAEKKRLASFTAENSCEVLLSKLRKSGLLM